MTPMRSFPVIKDLVTGRLGQLRDGQEDPAFQPRPRDADGTWRMQQKDIDRIQEFRKCIECFLCQNVCHVIRDHRKENFAGPRFLDSPGDTRHAPARHARPARARERRVRHGLLQHHQVLQRGVPESIHITDNGIIPLKERVADDFFDPVRWVGGKLTGAEDENRRRGCPCYRPTRGRQDRARNQERLPRHALSSALRDNGRQSDLGGGR